MLNFKHDYSIRTIRTSTLLFITAQSHHELFLNRSKASNESYICDSVSSGWYDFDFVFRLFFFRQLFYIFQFLLEIRERELKYMNIVHASKSMQVCTSETEKQQQQK